MPTIKPDDTLLAAAGVLQQAISGGIAKSQYDKGIINQCMAILNTNDKHYQSDSVLQQRVQLEKAKDQRMAAAHQNNPRKSNSSR